MKKIFLLLFIILPLTASSQISRLGENVFYEASLTGTAASGGHAPFWFAANRYGLSTINDKSMLLQVGFNRSTLADSARHWRVGYGLELAGAAGTDNHFVLQQLYAEVQWKTICLSVGQKERPLELKNSQLSSGAMTTGINARPLPQIRLELPDFWTVPRTNGLFAVKAHIAFGAYTDNRWQRDFTRNTNWLYTNGSLYHTKELLMRIGNHERFPLTVTGGLEMSTQFGGEGWNMTQRLDDHQKLSTHRKLFHGIKSIWHAVIPGGGDEDDGEFSNAEGNMLGSWHLRLDWKGQGWSVGAYLEHYFEDESQLFWQYGWKDYQLGLEVNLPKNPVLSTFVYEHLGTMDQSGPIYHDSRDNLPEQISGVDEYYNNHVYGAWQHAGFVMGNPLILSPIYNKNGRIYCYYNRVNAHHVGAKGQPARWMQWRVLYTHLRTLGTYHSPVIDPKGANYLLAELTWRPTFLSGLSLTGAYGYDGGSLTGRSHGGMLTFTYEGVFNRK